MVSAAGRGKPRPLLAGVFRKACDFCVRSKRGCNGGTPCEQCIRRDQPCTYSQRRKSGPRGRPIRQQSATPPPPPCAMVGVRTSSRRTKGTSSYSSNRDGSPEPSTVSSASSSPDREAAVSSSGSSSPSDYSASDDSFSDSETEAFAEADQERQQQGVGGVEEDEEVAMLSAQKAKKSKISGPEDNRKTVREVSPSVALDVSPKMLETPTAATTATTAAVAATATAATAAATATAAAAPVLVIPRPQLAAAGGFSRPSAILEGGSVRPKKEVAWQPRTLSPSTVAPPSLHHHRAAGSSWTQPLLASETSTKVQQQQTHRSSGGVGVALQGTPTLSSTSSTPSTTSITTICSNSSRAPLIHEISMQPWEFSRSGGARPVIASPRPLLLPTSGNYFSALAGGVSMDVADVSLVGGVAAACASSEAGPMPMPTSAVLRGSTPTSSSSSSFDGALRLEGEDFCDEGVEEDFDVGLDCADWEMPSLTREMSLARVVEALGGEHSTQGIGFEGSLVSGW